MPERVIMFAGPSLYGTGLRTEPDGELEWRPPVRRGDIEKLVAAEKVAGVIGLADGTFHSYPSVSHVELREAVEHGWKVFGLCSMGAIRAAEMVHMGLKPFGRVAAKFCTDPDYPDDEVALIHGSESPFTPMSEPMIHIREFLRHAQTEKVLSQTQVDELIACFANRWYAERTLRQLRIELTKSLGSATLPPLIESALRDFSPYRIKQADLVAFVTDRPWAAASQGEP